MMALGKNGELERKAAGERAKEDEAVVLRDEAGTVGALGMEDIAEKAALFQEEMFAGTDELAFDEGRDERKRDEL